MASNINMRGVQEGVEDNVKMAREVGRKALLATLGAAGLTYDLGKSIMKDSSSWLNKAESRGESVEKELGKVFDALQQDFPGEVMRLANNLQAGLNSAANEVGERSQRFAAYAQQFAKNSANSVSETVVDIQVTAEEEINKQAQMVSDSVQSAVDTARSNGVSAMTSMKIETPASVEDAMEKATGSVQSTVDSALNKLWRGYDELGVKEIIAGLEGKSMSTLEKVRAHEINGKNRVTVVREIDAKMQAMTS